MVNKKIIEKQYHYEKCKKEIPCNVYLWVYNIRPLLPVLKYRIIIVHVIETICDLKVR